jgi:hypothetical protein
MKLPKFMIAQNPMVDESEYIAHSRDPVFFAKIIPDGRTFRLEPDRDVPEKLILRAKDWYIAYLNRNDGQNRKISD